MTKICGKCQVEKDENEFPPRGKIGRRAWCRECYRIYNRKNDHDNRPTRSEQHRIYAEKNPEKIAEIEQRSRDNHKLEKKERNKKRSEDH
jgi:hypothetical protein